MNNKDDENLGSFYMGRTRSPAGPKRRFPPGVLTAVALFAFAGILWYAYPRGAEKYSDMDVPVVKADTAPIKAEPVDPGGMEVRHQDSTVFDPLEKSAGSEVEKLLPAQEEPLNKDVEIKSKVAAPDVAETSPVPVKAEGKRTAAASAGNAAKGNVYIQLGSFHDIEGAKKDWLRLKTKYPELLGNLEMKTERADLGAKGVYFRLQAGKLDGARAKEVCAALKVEKAGGCILVRK